MWNLTENKKPKRQDRYLCVRVDSSGKIFYYFYLYEIYNDRWIDGTGHSCITPIAWLDVEESIPFITEG